MCKCVRTAIILLKNVNKKILSSKEIQFAIFILFSGEKCKKAISQGINNINNYYSNYTPDTSINDKRNKIRSIIIEFGIRKMHDQIIYFLDGIYDNIIINEPEEIIFNSLCNVDDIIKKCNHIAAHENVFRLKDTHYDILQEILSPNIPFSLNWNIERNKECLKKFLYQSNYSFSESFLQKLIYKKLG